MKVVGFLGFALAFMGCGLIQQLEGDTSSTTTGAGGGSGVAEGAECGTDPSTSAILCLQNTLCAGITIDSSVYPGCGFRVNGTVVDIECSCSGYLCPLGASTCAQATTMLAAENYSQVCAPASSGNCAQGTPVATGAAATSSSGGSCDTVCRSECGADINCIQQCGC
jgi:hypothetical protein